MSAIMIEEERMTSLSWQSFEEVEIGKEKEI